MAASTNRNHRAIQRGGRRPVEFVRHPNTGEPVGGLRLHKPSGRFYRIESGKKRHYYARRGLQGVAYLQRAVFDHLCWVEGREPETTETLIVTKPAVDDFGDELQGIGSFDESGFPVNVIRIDQADLAAYVRDQLLNEKTRFEFAALVGIPELAHLDRLQPLALSMQLSEVRDLYLGRKKAASRKSNRDAKAYWDEFSKLVDVGTVGQLTIKHIENYHDTIFNAYELGKSVSYVRARFSAVKTMLRYVIKRAANKSELQCVLEMCVMLTPPSNRNGFNPVDISPKHFRELLSVANTKWRAILLISLNCALYPVDVCRITKAALDLKKRTLREYRTKTGVPRIAVLWKSTVHAVRAYLREEPHEHETLFVSEAGTPYRIGNQVRKNFVKLRERAGVPSTVQFAHMRDGASTAAIEGGADPVRVEMLLGHRTGIRDNYTLRKPSMVAGCCAAIARHYGIDTKPKKPRRQK